MARRVVQSGRPGETKNSVDFFFVFKSCNRCWRLDLHFFFLDIIIIINNILLLVFAYCFSGSDISKLLFLDQHTTAPFVGPTFRRGTPARKPWRPWPWRIWRKWPRNKRPRAWRTDPILKDVTWKIRASCLIRTDYSNMTNLSWKMIWYFDPEKWFDAVAKRFSHIWICYLSFPIFLSYTSHLTHTNDLRKEEVGSSSTFTSS